MIVGVINLIVMDTSSKAMQKLLQVKEKYLELSRGVIDYDKFNYYSIVHHGATIEGSTLTLGETYLLLDESLTPKNKPLLHTLMTVDHYNALKYVIELADSKKALDVNDIKKISSIILKNTGSVISSMAGDFDSSKGEFRKTTVRAGNRSFIDYGKVPNKVEELLDYIQNNMERSSDFVENSFLAFDSHFQMVSIHPFADGNGRLSRLVMNYIQRYHDQPMTLVSEDARQTYFDALEETRKNEDIHIFRKFMFNQSYDYFQKEIANLTKEQKQDTSKGGRMSFLF